MRMVIAGVICSFIAYGIGGMIEIMPTANFPGLGVALAVITMGGFILFQQRRK